MKKIYSKFLKLVTLAGALPFIYGCNSGGDGSAASVLFDKAVVDVASVPPPVELVSGTDLAALHSPEPASMLLLGGGLVAAAYFARRKK